MAMVLVQFVHEPRRAELSSWSVGDQICCPWIRPIAHGQSLAAEPLSTAEDIRAKHDLIHYHEAFPDPKDRRYMEKQLPAVNRFKRLGLSISGHLRATRLCEVGVGGKTGVCC